MYWTVSRPVSINSHSTHPPVLTPLTPNGIPPTSHALHGKQRVPHQHRQHSQHYLALQPFPGDSRSSCRSPCIGLVVSGKVNEASGQSRSWQLKALRDRRLALLPAASGFQVVTYQAVRTLLTKTTTARELSLCRSRWIGHQPYTHLYDQRQRNSNCAGHRHADLQQPADTA